MFSIMLSVSPTLRRAARCARQPRLLYGYKPSVQKTRFVKIQNLQDGLPKDRRLRADGLIIRAQAAIRADGFRPRKFGEGLRAARANPVQILRIHTIRKI
jgi:hypothetical protein